MIQVRHKVLPPRMQAAARFRRATRVFYCGAMMFGIGIGDAPHTLAESAARPITLEEAVTFAIAHHPALRFSAAREESAQARVDEARTTELPGLGVSAQVNRSTGNTIPGT